jgi:hypothetical protein
MTNPLQRKLEADCFMCSKKLSERNVGTAYQCKTCFSETSRIKMRAHSLVAYEIRAGRLAKLASSDIRCVDCGEEAECYDHRDYRKPLDVSPVCDRCDAARGMGEPYRTLLNAYWAAKGKSGRRVDK